MFAEFYYHVSTVTATLKIIAIDLDASGNYYAISFKEIISGGSSQAVFDQTSLALVAVTQYREFSEYAGCFLLWNYYGFWKLGQTFVILDTVTWGRKYDTYKLSATMTAATIKCLLYPTAAKGLRGDLRMYYYSTDNTGVINQVSASGSTGGQAIYLEKRPVSLTSYEAWWTFQYSTNSHKLYLMSLAKDTLLWTIEAELSDYSEQDAGLNWYEQTVKVLSSITWDPGTYSIFFMLRSVSDAKYAVFYKYGQKDEMFTLYAPQFYKKTTAEVLKEMANIACAWGAYNWNGTTFTLKSKPKRLDGMQVGIDEDKIDRNEDKIYTPFGEKDDKYKAVSIGDDWRYPFENFPDDDDNIFSIETELIKKKEQADFIMDRWFYYLERIKGPLITLQFSKIDLALQVWQTFSYLDKKWVIVSLSYGIQEQYTEIEAKEYE